MRSCFCKDQIGELSSDTRESSTPASFRSWKVALISCSLGLQHCFWFTILVVWKDSLRGFYLVLLTIITLDAIGQRINQRILPVLSTSIHIFIWEMTTRWNLGHSVRWIWARTLVITRMIPICPCLSHYGALDAESAWFGPCIQQVFPSLSISIPKWLSVLLGENLRNHCYNHLPSVAGSFIMGCHFSFS